MTCPTSLATLRKYGWSAADWEDAYRVQGGVCPICRRGPPEVKLCIDHEHVPGWKWMAPAYRRLFVRGLVCVFCNRNLLHWGLTVARARECLSYLARYALRRPATVPKVTRKRKRKRRATGRS